MTEIEKVKPEHLHPFILGKFLKFLRTSGYAIKGTSYMDDPPKGEIDIDLGQLNKTVKEITETLLPQIQRKEDVND